MDQASQQATIRMEQCERLSTKTRPFMSNRPKWPG